ncbi:serine hydrolase domain-containing protein [Peristeroidobacter soli]|uniref:serine hydrolase domain-containing protein n=1 Tax=Peristeroidobacter soli TaxID=2497877 RepID=UPI0013003F64|nr:serine hydrolase domain-containing protein [Peristeroidobacter soli]
MRLIHHCLHACLVAGWTFTAQAVAADPAPKAPDKAAVETLDTLRKEYGFPGAAAAFKFADGTEIVVVSGLADRETQAPVEPDSRFMSGSTGKTFAAATALHLAHDGKLDLDAPISRYLGERAWFSRLPGGARITTRQLLMHSSGLIDHVYTEAFARDSIAMLAEPDSALTPEQSISYVLDSKPRFAPGTRHGYTDTGYLLVGLIIEQVSGRHYYDLVADYFLRPLHLDGTAPAERRALDGLVQGYPAPDMGFPLPSTTLEKPGVLRWNPASEWTGGGFVTTPRDLARWAWHLYGGSALQGSYVTDLVTGIPARNDADMPRYALGTVVFASPAGLAYGHSGWYPGYRSDLVFYPEHCLAVAFQINTDGKDYGNARMAAMRDRLTQSVIGKATSSTCRRTSAVAP